MTSNGLDGRIYVITGAFGGLGAAIVRAAAAEGAQLALPAFLPRRWRMSCCFWQASAARRSPARWSRLSDAS